jgi:hypothetical protein
MIAVRQDRVRWRRARRASLRAGCLLPRRLEPAAPNMKRMIRRLVFCVPRRMISRRAACSYLAAAGRRGECW